MKYKALIFDIDNTLVNTLDMNMIPLQKIIQEEKGEEWTLEEVYHFASYPGMKVMEELEVNNPEEVYARWVKNVNEYQASPYEGMDDVSRRVLPISRRVRSCFRCFRKNEQKPNAVSVRLIVSLECQRGDRLSETPERYVRTD